MYVPNSIEKRAKVRYSVSGSSAKIQILQEGSIKRYKIIEPLLTLEEQSSLQCLKEVVRDNLKDPIIYRRLLKSFKSEIISIAQNKFPDLEKQSISNLVYYIIRDTRGLGPIQPLFEDPNIIHISITGPDQIITVQHQDHGVVYTSLELSSTGIRKLSKKLYNRAIQPVKSWVIPLEITLKSGHLVKFSKSPGDSTIPCIHIEKPYSPLVQSSPQNHRQIITKYLLYNNIIEILVIRSKDNQYQYCGSFSLTDIEKKALLLAKQEDAKNSGLSPLASHALRFSYDEFSIYMSQINPEISENRYRHLFIALSFMQDPTRWIRLLISDPNITQFQCTHPDTPIVIWHNIIPGEILSFIRPTRSDMNRFADFLIQSSGQQINPDDNEINLRFKSGEKILLVRVTDDKGHYYQVDLCKKNDCSDNKKTDTFTSVRINGSSNNETTGVYAERTEDLVDSIFSRQGPASKSTPEQTHGGSDGSMSNDNEEKSKNSSSLKTSLKNLISFGSKKKSEFEGSPFSDNQQLPSALNIQTKEGTVAEEAYWLYQPHSYVVITRDENKERMYKIIEPELSPRERIILEETHETLRDVLVYDKPVSKGELFLEYKEVAKVVRTYDPKISEDRLLVLYYYLRRNLNGYGKIDPLMYDELLEDISCNGHDLPVYVHHRFYGSIPTSIRFDAEDLNRFVLKLSQKADKQVSLTSPLLDASLPNGSRAQITYSDVVSTKGSSFTIRKFRSDPMTPATLLSFGTYSDELLAFIWLTLENRQSMIVVGGTASGKTSAMNAFSFFIPHNSKIVSLEDTREIQIPQKNWLPVQTRTSSSFNDRGNVDLFDLLKASLRQRPEYIIVGEVRGNEAQTLFQAMNSGHTTISTLHAGNIEEALNRLTNEPINVPPAMFGALNLMVIQTFHYREGRMIRRCDAIHEILLGEGDKVRWNTLFEYVPEDDSFRKVYSKSKTLQTIQYMHNWSEEEIRYQLDLRAAFLSRLRHQYSTNPEILIQMIADLRRRA